MVHAALQGFLDGRMFSEICTNHRISPPELKALQGSEWLSDTVINAAQSIISTQFPHKCGFQDVLYGQGLKFKKMKKFIQILHVPSPGHWITVTNLEPLKTQFSFMIHLMNLLLKVLSVR